MPKYGYKCPIDGYFEREFSIGHATPAVVCDTCSAYSPRDYAGHFASISFGPEDRTRFFRNANGSRYSSALGQEMPDSRQEADRIAKSKGIELVRSKEDAPPHWKRAAEYAKEMKGREQLPAKEVAKAIAEPKQQAETVTSLLKKSNFRLGDYGL